MHEAIAMEDSIMTDAGEVTGGQADTQISIEQELDEKLDSPGMQLVTINTE